jgi:malonyl-CoA O-methyltransferase
VSPAGRAPLAARDAYRLWAPNYDTENPVTMLDQMAVERLTPRVSQHALLDAGCGTGRRLPSADSEAPHLAIGIDIVPEMLRSGRGRSANHRLVCGDTEALPIAGGLFDTVWCRLVVGHLSTVVPSYREFGRVCRRRATIVVTDFHPSASAAGCVRGFHDVEGNAHVVEHNVHQLHDHEEAAASAGFRLDACLDMTVGSALAPAYEHAGKHDEYDEQLGTPLVLALRFVR